MSKKYLLHRITEEDAEYIASETNVSYNNLNNGKCYVLINKNSGKIYKDKNDNLIIYKATNTYDNIIDKSKRRFLEAIEACAYFRGYANIYELNFKTTKIPELMYKLEDHEIEIPSNFNYCSIVTKTSTNNELKAYRKEAMEGYDTIVKLQRNLPTFALFLNDSEPYLDNTEEEEFEI